MASTHVHSHPALGSLTGVLDCDNPDVLHFRGIRYATLASPFAASIPTTSVSGGNCTAFSPQPPQNPGACAIEWFLIGAERPGEGDHTTSTLSRTDCLSLTITLPVTSLSSAKQLPVLFFIHGGNFQHGAHSWPQYRPTRLLSDSPEPYIFVACNYRTNIFGFSEHPSLPSNRGLNDIRNALAWTKTHIPGFNGDASRITLLGQSAGAAAVEYILASPSVSSGVSRAIIMSGDSTLKPSLPAEAHAAMFSDICKTLALSPATAIQELEHMDLATLYAKLPGNTPFHPLATPDTALPLQYSATILAGHTLDDGNILLPPPASPIAEKLDGNLGFSRDMNDDAARARLMQLYTHHFFRDPVVKMTQATGWRYVFSVRNPWDGPWKGLSNHILDLACLFGGFDGLDPEVGKDMRREWGRFVAGSPEMWEGVKGFGGKQEVVEWGESGARELLTAFLVGKM